MREPVILATVVGFATKALSMVAGEYVSVSSQRDLEKSDIKREKKELKDMPDIKLERLSEIYEKRRLHKATAVIAQKNYLITIY